MSAFEKQWPAISWREPISIAALGRPGQRFGCRLCIGELGLKGSDIATCEYLFDDREVFDKHLAEKHKIGEV